MSRVQQRRSVCVCVEFVSQHGGGKMLRSWNHQHTVTHVPSPLVTGPAPEEESINFPPCCQSYPETYTDVFGLRCHGNSLIHWSAVVTILHSGMITPHWDLGRREQLKVVTVKRAYPLVGYVNFNDRLTDDPWFPLFRRLCRLRQIHRTCLSGAMNTFLQLHKQHCNTFIISDLQL